MARASAQQVGGFRGRLARIGRRGLYDSGYEHDACGVGFVADLSGRRSHDTVAKGLAVLRNLEHRGAKGSDPDTGDSAGILTQIPMSSSARSPGLRCLSPGPTRQEQHSQPVGA